MATIDAPTQPRILFVDDRVSDLWALRNTMAARGFDLEIAGDPPTALEMARAHKPDIAVLDYSMPPFNGVELCRKLKKLYPALYVIFVTSHTSADIRDQCLEVGDKFLTKGYTGEELVESVIEGYAQRVPSAEPSPAMASFGAQPQPLSPVAEPPARDLTPKEWLLLKRLKDGKSETVTRDELIDALWGAVSARSGALEQTIRRLRRKVEPDPKHPRIILTVREDGYRLDPAALRRAHGDRY